MAPPCTGLKGFSALNKIVAPDAWHKSRSVSVPLGDLAGENCPTSTTTWQALHCGEPTKLRAI
eukprot:8896736-Prorocentrum_lima.AAC.1